MMNTMAGDDVEANKQLSEYVRDDPMVVRELCGLIRVVIEPCYALLQRCRLGQSPREKGDKSELLLAAEFSLQPVTDIIDVLPCVAPLLVFAGHRLSSDVVLIVRLLRLFREILVAHGPDGDGSIISHPSGNADVDRSSDGVKRFRILTRVLGCCILPSISMLDSPNPGLLGELWDLIGRLPYAERYSIYERWRSGEYPRVTALRLAARKARHKAKQVLKRVANDRDTMRIAGRNYAKIAHLHPTVAYSALLDNIQSYDNLITVVVDAIKYLTPVGFDILAYILVIYFSNERSKLKSDGTSHSHWLILFADSPVPYLRNIPK